MLSFHQVVEKEIEDVNKTIIRQLHSDVGLVKNIGHYIVEAGGKRLRPLLVLLVANMLGYQRKEHIKLAAIIEFIHTATLLHDDVVDLSSLRRGRVTANAKWGNAPSVLVGDFLYSRAFQMMVEIQSMDIMSILSNTTNLISEGEVQQLVNAKNPDVNEKGYLNVIHKKTAALFEAACDAAAVLAGIDKHLREPARMYGFHLGLAFQLIDDVLDYDGDAENLGKNVGDDLAEGKPTLPLIYTMAKGSEKAAKLISKAIEQGSVEKLDDILAAVTTCGGLEYTRQLALKHSQKARQSLEHYANSPYKVALLDLTHFAIERSH